MATLYLIHTKVCNYDGLPGGGGIALILGEFIFLAKERSAWSAVLPDDSF